MGCSELRDLHAQMDTILKEVGYTQRQCGRADEGAGEGSAYKFAEGDPGRAEIMAFIQERLTWIKAQMPRAFNTVVNPNMEVKRLPPEEEPGAPGAYGGAGSIDGTIPGRYWINLRTTDLHSKYSLADLTFHESIPGHIWQGEYTHAMPVIRTMLAFNAYSEGWALVRRAARRRVRRVRDGSCGPARLPAVARVPCLSTGGGYRACTRSAGRESRA